MIKCEECKYWELLSNRTGRGLCKRHAPQPSLTFTSETDSPTYYWPITFGLNKCGEGVKRSE